MWCGVVALSPLRHWVVDDALTCVNVTLIYRERPNDEERIAFDDGVGYVVASCDVAGR